MKVFVDRNPINVSSNELRRFVSEKTITLFDTSIASPNLGDQIIVSSVKAQLAELFPDHMMVSVPTHERVGMRTYALAKRSDYSFVAGTNLVKRNMLLDLQWRIRPWDLPFIRNIIGVGVGWRGAGGADLYTRYMIKRLFSTEFSHSVRDAKATHTFADSGLVDTLHTGCPTLWKLASQPEGFIASTKARDCVVTFNCRMPNMADRALARQLLRLYRKVYFWPQGIGDQGYGRDVLGDDAAYVAPSLEAFDELLNSHDSLDYVGLRLHGGIRALQKGRRAIIVGIDHRARDMADGTGLPVIERSATESLAALVEDSWPTKIDVPLGNLNRWKNQFRHSPENTPRGRSSI